MRLGNLRLWVQHVSFMVLMYGGRAGIRLGSALPCFACPYVPGCGGYCYLMGLQGYIGFGMGVAVARGTGLIIALGWFALFVLLVAVFGKLWCGWICPFGLIHDWFSSVRRFFGIRERILSPEAKGRLAFIKYGLLACIAVVPLLTTMGVLHEDFYLPFCSICPGKSILPLFAGETRYFSLNFDNAVSLGFSIALMTVTGMTLVGMFFKERFFCIFCPLLALIHILKPVTALRLVKSTSSCTGCGNCRRACPMDIEKVYREKLSCDVQGEECLDCGRCIESCPSDSAIGLCFAKLRLYFSSRSYVAEMRKWK
ncbi:MAG: 4Fe-4S binding protein [Synergistaceae bacterium]|nr:4Fe-4S binding protein [Synergistaceae bacterium]